MDNFLRKTKNALINPAGITSNAIDYVSGRGDRRAANQSASALRSAIEQARPIQEQAYNEAYDLQKPYYEMGNEALRNLYEGLNSGKYDYQAPSNQEVNSLTQQMIAQDPGVDWRLKQGQKALDASAAARGMLLSSGQQKALNNYAQNQASQEYQQAYNRANNVVQDKYAAIRDNLSNHFNRLQAFANMGPQGAQNLASNRLNLAQTRAGYAEDMGNVNAGRFNAINQANMGAMDNLVRTGVSVAGLMTGNPGMAVAAQAPARSSQGTMDSARQMMPLLYDQPKTVEQQLWNPTWDYGVASSPATVPADYQNMGNQLSDMWRKGYPGGY